MQKIENPVTELALSDEAADYVRQLRTVRSNARKASRSGNPAKKYPALAATEKAAHLIRLTYISEASK